MSLTAIKRVILCLISVWLMNGCTQQDSSSRRIVFEEAGPGVLNVLTFNIRYGSADDGPNSWGYRRELVFSVLADHRADVAGLQEAEHFQIQQIRRVLPQYGVVAACRDDGVVAGEACPVLYRRDRFTLLDSGTFWFSDTPDQPGSMHWGNTLPRICTWVRLLEKETGVSFYVYNLHLDHASQQSRRKSTELLARVIADRSPADPFVVTGDFNMAINNPALQYLQKDGYETPCARLADSWQRHNPARDPAGTFNGFKGTTDGAKIDYILVTDDTETLEADIDTRAFEGCYPSDHFPVHAKIKLNR